MPETPITKRIARDLSTPFDDLKVTVNEFDHGERYVVTVATGWLQTIVHTNGEGFAGLKALFGEFEPVVDGPPKLSVAS